MSATIIISTNFLVLRCNSSGVLSMKSTKFYTQVWMFCRKHDQNVLGIKCISCNNGKYLLLV